MDDFVKFRAVMASIEDGRGKFPEDVKARARLGTRDRISATAAKLGISNGEFIRRAIDKELNKWAALEAIRGTAAKGDAA